MSIRLTSKVLLRCLVALCLFALVVACGRNGGENRKQGGVFAEKGENAAQSDQIRPDNETATGESEIRKYRYTIEEGARYPLCQKFKAHLESLEPPPLKPGTFGYCAPPLPVDPDFSDVGFKNLDPRAHMDVVKEIELSERRAIPDKVLSEIDACADAVECLDAIWEREPMFEQRTLAQIEAGFYVLRRATFDLNWDGKQEPVYQYRETGLVQDSVCTPWTESSETQSTLQLFVRKSDDEEIHHGRSFRAAKGARSVFRYKGRTYLLRGSSRNPLIYETAKLENVVGGSFVKGICAFGGEAIRD